MPGFPARLRMNSTCGRPLGLPASGAVTTSFCCCCPKSSRFEPSCSATSGFPGGEAQLRNQPAAPIEFQYVRCGSPAAESAIGNGVETIGAIKLMVQLFDPTGSLP